LALIKDLRFLSPAYEQAIVVAALAALECKEFERAEFYARNIENDDIRLKIVTRIAQATGDLATEIDALTRLYQGSQCEPAVFVQLVQALHRIQQTELIRALCLEAQERFSNDATVQGVVNHFMSKR
jgi:hypothetical protein